MDSGKCTSCGSLLGAGSRSGLCPNCLAPGVPRPRTTEDAAAANVAVLQAEGSPAPGAPAAVAGMGDIPPFSEVPPGWRPDPFRDGIPGEGGGRRPTPEDGGGVFWTPTSPAPHIEGYEVLRPLKQGGQGIVYLAVQRSTKRKVAIKVLLAGAFASKSPAGGSSGRSSWSPASSTPT